MQISNQPIVQHIKSCRYEIGAMTNHQNEEKMWSQWVCLYVLINPITVEKQILSVIHSPHLHALGSSDNVENPGLHDSEINQISAFHFASTHTEKARRNASEQINKRKKERKSYSVLRLCVSAESVIPQCNGWAGRGHVQQPGTQLPRTPGPSWSHT